MRAIDLILHPVRLRILHAMYGVSEHTTAELCRRLPDISKATVYRHVSALAEGGVLEVAGEHRVRGAVERSYRLRRDSMVIDAETAAAMTLDDHRRAVTAALAALLGEFEAYTGRETADPVADLVTYRQNVLWLDERERAEFLDELRASVAARVGNPPAPGRRPHLLSTVMFPTGEAEE